MNFDKPIDMSGPALRAFLTISREWGLTERQRRDLLGGPTPMTLAAWERAARVRERVRVPDAVLSRIQLLLQIRCAVKKSMPDPDDQAAWLRVRNREIDGRPPLDWMCESSEDLARVRDQVAGWTR
jgi:hypothetical protein